MSLAGLSQKAGSSELHFQNYHPGKILIEEFAATELFLQQVTELGAPICLTLVK